MIKKITITALLCLTLAPLASAYADDETTNATGTEEVKTEKPAKPPVVFLPASEVAKHAQTIKRVEDYLSGLTTITSEFMQVSPDGSYATGKFYMERPNKMRWQYNPPVPVLMVSSGSELIYYDSELEQITHIPLRSTLIGFLAQDKIHFDKKVGIISFLEKNNTIRIGISQRAKPGDGQLVLEFSDKPLIIRSMVVTDASGQVTTVSLNNASFGGKIDKTLFEFKDTRKKRRK
jgi:outer membrane lipoprotein-sorting protein